MIRIPRDRLPLAVTVLALTVVAAVLAFVGASLVFGGDDGPGDSGDNVAPSDAPGPTLSKEEADAITPPPPPPGMTPAPGSGDNFYPVTPVATLKGPESVEISGVVIPVPEGAHHYYGPAAAGAKWTHQVWFGDSNYRESGSAPLVMAGILFDEYGLRYSGILVEEEAAFSPTLDALWALAQAAGTPSPAYLTVKGVNVPLPEGSYYTTVSSDTPPEFGTNIVRYYVRLNHSVLMFRDTGTVASYITKTDEAKFLNTLVAVEGLRVNE